MSAKETDINTIIGKVITRSHAIEKLLRTHYKAAGRGLHKAIDDLSDTLPAVLVRTLRVVANVRNAAAHPDEFTAPPDFDRLCDEIEILIPFFAGRDAPKPAQPAQQPKVQAPKPQKNAPAPKPPDANSEPQPIGIATNAPPAQPKPWTPAEEKQLTDGFEAQATIPELAKALNRGIGGVQRKLIKLGKLAADQYKVYPPDSQ
jgi:hypothetical protein